MTSKRRGACLSGTSAGSQRFVASQQLVAGLVLLAAMVGSGCGQSNALNRQAIAGTVTLDGNPVAVGAIRFSPELPAGVSSGGTLADGKFEIPESTGLPPGKYLVRIYSTQQDNRTVDQGAPPGPSTEKPGLDLIPPRYNAQSELTCEVVEGKPNVFDFPLVSGKR